MSKKNHGAVRGEHKVSERLAKKLAEIRQKKLAEVRQKKQAEVRQKKQAETVSEKEYYRGPHVISDLLAAKLSENHARRETDDALAREKALKEIHSSVQLHYPALSRNLRKSVSFDDYNSITEDNRREVALSFFASLKIDCRKVQENEAIGVLISEVDRLDRLQKERGFDPSSYPVNGHEFEYWLAEALGKFDWEAQVTIGSGDQGVDIIARKAGKTVAIQAKRYTGNVGNKAVQEIYSGAMHLGIKSAVVITTTGFTKSAVELSNTTGVKLLFVEDIPRLEELLKGQ